MADASGAGIQSNDTGGASATDAKGGSPSGAGSGSLCCVMPASGGSGGLGAGDHSVGGGDTCDDSTLWLEINEGSVGGLGECHAASATLAPDEHLGPTRGVVVIDADGRVVDNTGLTGSRKNDWLAQLMDQRWICLAGQSIGYKCTIAA